MIWYWDSVTISPSRTMTSRLTSISGSTASRAFWRLASVISVSMSMFGWMQMRRISEMSDTAPVGYFSSTRSRVMRVTAEDSWPSGRVEFSVSRTPATPAS